MGRPARPITILGLMTRIAFVALLLSMFAWARRLDQESERLYIQVIDSKYIASARQVEFTAQGNRLLKVAGDKHVTARMVDFSLLCVVSWAVGSTIGGIIRGRLQPVSLDRSPGEL
jgi:hypothetical protein